MRFVIHKDDHPPAHVHVMGDSEAKFTLATDGGRPELVWNDGLKGGDLRKAERTIFAEQAMLLKRWEELHGGTD